jgi:hypothetical protein
MLCRLIPDMTVAPDQWPPTHMLPFQPIPKELDVWFRRLLEFANQFLMIQELN